MDFFRTMAELANRVNALERIVVGQEQAIVQLRDELNRVKGLTLPQAIESTESAQAKPGAELEDLFKNQIDQTLEDLFKKEK